MKYIISLIFLILVTNLFSQIECVFDKFETYQEITESYVEDKVLPDLKAVLILSDDKKTLTIKTYWLSGVTEYIYNITSIKKENGIKTFKLIMPKQEGVIYINEQKEEANYHRVVLDLNKRTVKHYYYYDHINKRYRIIDSGEY